MVLAELKEYQVLVSINNSHRNAYTTDLTTCYVDICDPTAEAGEYKVLEAKIVPESAPEPDLRGS